MENSIIEYADFSLSCLNNSNFINANCRCVNFIGTHLIEVNFNNANLSFADFNIRNTFVSQSIDNFPHELDYLPTFLNGSNFKNAILNNANFIGSNLDNIVNWKEIKSIKGANITGIKNAPEGFREWALANGAIENPPDEEINVEIDDEM